MKEKAMPTPSETSRSFAKNVAFSYSNKIVTILVSFLYTFLIANYLGPEKYGLVTYFISFITGLSGTLGFNFLISTISNYFPKTKSSLLFRLVLKLLVFLSIAAFIVLFLFASPVSSFLGKGNASLLQSASFLILLTPSFTLLIGLFQGFKRFGSTLKIIIAESILNLAFAFTAVILLRLDVYGVIYAKIFSTLAALALFAFYYRKLSFSSGKIDRKDLKHYLITAAPFSFIRGFEGTALTVVIGMFISDLNLGLYYMAQKLASLAIITPINSLREVLLPYSLEKSGDRKTIGNYASINIKFSLIISIIFAALLLAFGWFALHFLFPEFEQSYYYLPFFAVNYVLSSFSVFYVVYTSLNRLEYAAIAEFIPMVLMIASALFYLVPAFGVLGAIFAETVYYVSNGVLLYYFLRKAGIKVEVIPRIKDLKYFYSAFLRNVLKIK